MYSARAGCLIVVNEQQAPCLIPAVKFKGLRACTGGTMCHSVPVSPPCSDASWLSPFPSQGPSQHALGIGRRAGAMPILDLGRAVGIPIRINWRRRQGRAIEASRS